MFIISVHCPTRDPSAKSVKIHFHILDFAIYLTAWIYYFHEKFHRVAIYYRHLSDKVYCPPKANLDLGTIKCWYLVSLNSNFKNHIKQGRHLPSNIGGARDILGVKGTF